MNAKLCNILLLSSCGLLVTGVAAQDRIFTDRADVVLVQIPVHVLDGGEPVRGLTIDDFIVTEGRKKHRLVGFEVVDLTRASGESSAWTENEERDIPVAARRHFLALFDLSFSDAGSIARARGAVQDLVLRGMHPTDLVAVATYSERQGIEVVLNFTGDRAQILAAIDSLGLMDPLDRPRDPLRLMVADVQNEIRNLEGGGGGIAAPLSRADRLDIFLETLRDQQSHTIRTTREQKQGQLMALTNSLGEMSELLAEVEGRTHVLFLSEGFDSSLILGTSNEDQGRLEEIRQAVENGQYWRVDNDERFGSGAALFGITHMLEGFRRAGATIQSIDIAGLRTDDDSGTARREATVRQDGLFLLANDTGGQLYKNANDLTDAMDDLLESTGVSYLLSFQPDDLIADGSYHAIEVKLAKRLKGARVVHREGYFAPRPYSATDGVGRRTQNSQLLLGGGTGGRIQTAVLATPMPGDSPRTWVPVLIEIDGPSLLEGVTETMMPVEIYGYALRKDESIADFFAQAVGLSLDETRTVLTQSGFKFWGHLDLDPGAYRLRTLVRNAVTGAISLGTYELEVPDTGTNRAYLSEPLFPEPKGKWLFGEEQNDRPRTRYPYQREGDRFMPAARPILERGATTEVVLVGGGWDAQSSEASARLFDAEGRLAGSVQLEVVGRSDGSSSEPSQLIARLRPDVEPGSYVLEMRIDSAPDQPVSSLAIEVR